MLGRRRQRPEDEVAVPDVPAVLDEGVVLAAVEAVIRADGLLAVTPQRLAADLGTTPDRLDLDRWVGETYRRVTVTELADVRRAVLANPSPVEQLRALLAWLATPPEDSDAVRLEAWVLSRRNATLRSAVQDSEAAWHAFVASVVRRGARNGDFLQADADEVAAQVISLIDGINAYQLIGYRSDLDRMRLLTRLLRSELGLIWGPELADALTAE